MSEGSAATTVPLRPAHAGWVRLSHWVLAVSVLTLATSGLFILGAHPRLYWGTVGNDLTPALIELPVSRNYKHRGWTAAVPFYAQDGSPVTAERTYDIFNENGWARSLHFLAAWFLIGAGLLYAVAALWSGHFKKDLLPRRRDLALANLMSAIASHTRGRPVPGPPYNPLQKVAYSMVVFVALPVMALSGMTMSPAINAACPWLSTLFSGTQSARTIHFGVFVLLALFAVGHVVMVFVSGFGRQMHAMTFGGQK